MGNRIVTRPVAGQKKISELRATLLKNSLWVLFFSRSRNKCDLLFLQEAAWTDIVLKLFRSTSEHSLNCSA